MVDVELFFCYYSRVPSDVKLLCEVYHAWGRVYSHTIMVENITLYPFSPTFHDSLNMEVCAIFTEKLILSNICSEICVNFQFGYEAQLMQKNIFENIDKLQGKVLLSTLPTQSTTCQHDLLICIT